METVKGYKVFNQDWTCLGKQYCCPGEFEEDVELELCSSGMHFCENLADCFNYYDFNSANHVAEVESYGEVIKENDKCCTNKLRIIREIEWDEVLRICNTGNCNTGDWNTGDWNTGDCNTGDCNTGDWNTGCFMTKDQTIPFFDKPSDWTYDNWLDSRARKLLNSIDKNVVEWIYSKYMTEEEKNRIRSMSVPVDI